MRILIITAILIISANFASAECTDFMQAFSKHQLIIKGMMDMNFEGKLNTETADAIGKGLQEAQEPLDSGEYDKACEIYDSIIADYGFDTSFESEKSTTGNGESKNTAETTTSGESSSTSASEAAASPGDSKSEIE